VPETSTSLPSSTEAALESLRGQVDAFDRHLFSSAAQASRLVRYRKEELLGALEHLRATVQGAPGTSATIWSVAMRPSADALENALANGRAPGVAALEAQHGRIERAATALHAALADAFARAGQRFDGPTLRALRRFQQALQALEAELRIAVACRRLTAGCRGRALAERRRELADQIRSLSEVLDQHRAEMAAHRERSATLWRAIDAGLREEVEVAGAAFERLLSASPSGGARPEGSLLARSGKTPLGGGA
jgi:tetratricopeptide (TPR) repeat protein